MTEENKNLNPQAEGSNTASGSSDFRTVIEEDILSSNGSDFDSDFDYSSDEEWSEKDYEISRLINEIKRLESEMKILDKSYETKLEKWKKMPDNSEGERELKKEIEKEGKEYNAKVAENKKLLEKFFELKKERERNKELSASTAKGKEIIKAEITKELTEAKEIFANFQVSKASKEEISRKAKKKLESLEREGLIQIPMKKYLIFRIGEPGGTTWKKSEELREKLEETVLKLVDKTTDDLEKAKKKVLKKMDALIETRNQEVAEAKEAIAKMESTIEGLKLTNRKQKEKSNREKSEADKEISKLQEGIKELNEQLKEYQKEKEDAENFFKKQREARLKKEMDGQGNIKSPIQDPQAKIKKLEKDIDDLEMELKIVRSDRDLTKGEVKNLKSELEREIESWGTKLINKEKELEDEKEIYEQKLKTWQETYNWAEERRKKAEVEVEKIKENRDEIEEERDDLLTKNKELKDKREKAEAEARKWKSEYESEKALHEPTWIQKGMKFLGVEKLQNAIATSASIAGCFVILWGVSWMWKNVIKETWKNFKGEPAEEPRPRKKEKVRYEDYEEIVESKEKPQSLPEKQPTIIINNSTPAEKEPNQSAAISKEGGNNGEISTQISSEKTDPIREEKAEVEKPAKESKNGKKAKKKKNKKKVKDDSS